MHLSAEFTSSRMWIKSAAFGVPPSFGADLFIKFLFKICGQQSLDSIPPNLCSAYCRPFLVLNCDNRNHFAWRYTSFWLIFKRLLYSHCSSSPQRNVIANQMALLTSRVFGLVLKSVNELRPSFALALSNGGAPKHEMNCSPLLKIDPENLILSCKTTCPTFIFEWHTGAFRITLNSLILLPCAT